MSSQYTRRVILVVTATDRAQANADAQTAVPGCGPDTFTAGLVPAGSPPGTAPTHYWCSWQVTPTEAAALADRFGRGNTRGRGFHLGVAGDVPQIIAGEEEQPLGEILVELSLSRPPLVRD